MTCQQENFFNVFSSSLHQGSREEKRWLCEHAAKMFDQYVSDSVTELGNAQQVVSDPLDQEALPCRFSSCTRVFKYAKCRINHEKSKHGLVLIDAVQPPTCTQTTSQESDEILIASTPPESDAPRLHAEPISADSDELTTPSAVSRKSEIKKEDHIFNNIIMDVSTSAWAC